MSMRFWPLGPIPQDPTARLGAPINSLGVPRPSVNFNTVAVLTSIIELGT
jgi:hypothetical protein